MKNTKNLASIALCLLGATLSSANVFAAGDATEYRIDYTGGTELQNSVNIDPELIEGLTPLIQHSRSNLEVSDSPLWQDGYIESGGCSPYKYFTAANDEDINQDSNLKITLYNDKYAADVQFTGVSIDHPATDVSAYAIGVTSLYGYLEVGYPVFSDSQCENRVDGVKVLSLQGDSKVFVRTNISVRYLDANKPLISNGLYFGLTDIDAAQSYKILNQGNVLSNLNMYAKAADILQPDPSVTSLRNMYNADGHYIYSQFDPSQNPPAIGTSSISNIYVKIAPETQQEGLEMVFGFANTAGSGIEYYAKQFVVSYKSDEYGEILGIEDEPVIGGENPSGTEQQPEEGYIDKAWVADVDVKLSDGTTIKAGEPLTEAQVKSVVVDQDIVFTILHTPEEAPAVPNTGAATKLIESATIATASVFALLAIAIIIRALPRITRKKVNFD